MGTKTNRKSWRNKSTLSQNELDYIELQHKQQLPLEKHLAIINDVNLSEIQRASAIVLLPNSTRFINDITVVPWVNSTLPLIRLATAQVGHLLSITDRDKSYSKLLTDKFKAIRIKAVLHMLHSADDKLSGIKQAMKELNTANNVNK